MTDPDDVPIPRALVTNPRTNGCSATNLVGVPYWIQVARENLGPRRSKATADRPSLRESCHEMAGYDDCYGPEETA